MSFRRRQEVIGGAPSAPSPGVNSSRNPVLGAPSRGPLSPPSRAPLRNTPHVNPTGPSPGLHNRASNNDMLTQHPGIRPSTITSQPTLSTGSADLDRLLAHQGLPLGNSLLIEENGTTDFSSVLLKVYAAQGIVHNRTAGKLNTHVIVIGSDQHWGRQLPGLYRGSSKEQKKNKVATNESKVTVGNINDSNLKIAWRYGLKKDSPSEELSDPSQTYPNYQHAFDITSSLLPAPAANEMSFVPLNVPDYSKVMLHIQRIISQHQGKLIRIVLQSFLNPAMYPPQLIQHNQSLNFIKSLRHLLHNSPNISLVSSVNLDLYPRHNALVTMIEMLFDGVIELKPFPPELVQMMERIYKNQPAKIKQGFLNVLKLPVLSESGLMVIKEIEYCFKNGKKKFEIEEWSIPIDEEEEERSTTKDIEF
ncbi:Elongator complex protein 4 [Komagataella phaffii CBS 7435]|uniref:Elongator complex protein 4 n=2 Tax=Komagataella phaffii TaxID=460519 RepID=C4R074_KOMPG|nr:Subunit of Elongator complex, which is required for modification of wobble nucleosides in tRNA [Komagataella phaffii GS115]AOA61947.1 GQ67_00317T0 [Komagataella phaffii]CAH2448598.1 Elongator complex protein 4 [Komagataella phaffii CBS 7435]AOA67254.1 GQ68_01072T0 [Komagataella phaffii GS115]CAY68898.1 Subunit of Elongator complex, which is required for modification of wobble nucleosides in tRNA [Komagataella phaffii GS115]CCA38699.1 Elongator complex protein 4 [Komagataella phaffii CBS 743